MADLKINYEETISLGHEVSNKGDEFQKLLNNIKGINSELKSYWEGSDASKYTTSVATQAEKMQKLSDSISEIGKFLDKVGNAYRDAMEANSNAIK